MADKITIRAAFGQTNCSLGRIGRTGEKNARRVLFDCHAVLADRPNASIVCVLLRPNESEKEAYLAPLEETDEKGVFALTLRKVDVAKAGLLSIELRMIDGNELLKSAFYTGIIDKSHEGESIEPESPQDDMLTELGKAASEARNATTSANYATTIATEAV